MTTVAGTEVSQPPHASRAVTMTTVTGTEVSQSADDAVGSLLSEDSAADYPHSLPAHFPAGVDLKQSTVPLFSQALLTVEQLVQVTVDADIQASVDHFLKGITNQMFARIVRNGSAEVGQWLGAKVQSERDGWTALMRMAMTHIELHRKNALQGQVVLQDTLEQLVMLLDCFQLGEEARTQILQQQDDLQGIYGCLQLLADCCNTLMEDRFRCFDILGHGDDPSVPDSLSTAVQRLKDRLALRESEKESLEERLSASEGEASRLRLRNEQFLEEVQKMEEKMKKKQEDLEVLKTQLKEIDKLVKFRKNNTSDKCVETTVDMFRPSRKSPVPLSSKTKVKSTEDVSKVSSSSSLWTSREHVYTQTFHEPSLIELSEEKLRVLKERAKKLESSLHGAINTMGKLRTTAPPNGNSSSRLKPPPSSSSSSTTTSSSVLNKATFMAVPTRENSRLCHKPWMSASFQVTNAANSSVTASVPKLGHFQPTERRCFSERPAGKSSGGGGGAGEEPRDTNLAPGDRGKGDSSRKTSRTRTSQVSKCLRCQKIFTATDNHKLACCFHSKGKERMEVYNDDGQLVRVQYIWKCCHMKGDNDGCCFGHHV